MVTFSHEQQGTPEEVWTGWYFDRAPRAELDVETLFDGRLPETFVLLAAHPDDESLGAGGLLARLAGRGVRCDVVVMTDGEASHPRSPTHTPGQLGHIRRAEVLAAVAAVAPAAAVSFLGLPDGGLAKKDLETPLRSILGQDSRTLVAAPWRGDHHPDHDALGLAAAGVCAEYSFPLLEYPVWLWHWGTPELHEEILADITLLQLAGDELVLKASALALHASQTSPLSDQPGDGALLGPEILAHFERGYEAFFVTKGQSTFERLHRRQADPWQVANRFYERRKRSLTIASLPRERFDRTLEIGCSIGALTVELAQRSEHLLAIDTSPTAVKRTNEALEGVDGAEARLATVPQDWPEGEFDLIVVSETGYFLSAIQLGSLTQHIKDSLTPDGAVVLCHWRHPIEGWDLDGDTVHRMFRASSGLEVLALHTEDDFLLEVFTVAPASSVARREGIV